MDDQYLREKEQMLFSKLQRSKGTNMINGNKHILRIDSVLRKLLWKKKKNPETKFYNSQLYALPLREKEQNVI